MAKILTILLIFAVLLEAEDENAFAVTSFAKLKAQNTVLQNYEESCGAAALATLMGLFGIQKSEKEVLDRVAKTDMLSFSELSNAAKEFGFRAQGYKIDKSSFEKLRLPVIAKIQREKDYPHFVVAVNHAGDFVTLLDPSFGRYTIAKDEFYELWVQEGTKGFVLVALPQSGNAKPIVEPHLPDGVFLGR
jgi:uncharacterized protein